jgi:hypothetical protein
MIQETTPRPHQAMERPPSRVLLALLCLLFTGLFSLPGCTRREVFETENAAKAALVGKTSRDVISRLGAPNSVATVGSAEDRARRFTETWKYLRLIRDPKSRELKTLNVYFFRNRVAAVEIEK